MTSSKDNDMNVDAEAAPISRDEAEFRVAEILAERDGGEDDARARRTRAVLVVVLVILLLLLCGVGVFLYRLLVPGADTGFGDDDLTDTAGIIWVRSIYGFGSTEDELLWNPNDAMTDPDGVIWVSDPAKARVVGFRGDGTFVGIVQGDMQTGEPFRLPSRMAVDNDGILYLVDRANETLTIMDGDTQLAQQNIPGATCVAADDEVVVVGSVAGFAILDKEGELLSITGTKGTAEDQFDTVGGITLDSASRTIYVVDTFNNRLSAWDYEGARRWIVVLGNPANDVRLQGGMSLETSSVAPAALQLPTDVTVDGRGRPMVLDGFDFSISAFDPDNGDFLGKWGTYGDNDGQFMYPSGFDYDASKDWFTVADTDNRRAQIVRIEGTGPDGLAGLQTWWNRLVSGPARALWPCLSLLPLLLLLFAWRRKRRRDDEREAERLAAEYRTGVPVS